MSAKKLLLICLLLGTFLIIYPGNVSASSTLDQSGTEVGIHILKGGYPPSPEPPSPIIHKDTIVPTGYLPKTGTVSSYWWILIGSLLLTLTIYIKRHLWLLDKERRVSDEK